MIKVNKKVFMVAGIVLFVLVLLPVVAQQGQRYNNSKKEPSAMLSELKQQIEGEYSNVSVQQDAWTAQMGPFTAESVAGKEFKMSTDVAPTLSITLTDSSQSKSVKKWFFFNKKLKEAQSSDVSSFAQKQLKDEYGFSAQAGSKLIRGDITCTAGEELGATKISCSSEKILKEAADRAEEYVKAYITKHGDLKISDIAIGRVQIKSENSNGVISASKSAGYDIAETVIKANDKLSLVLFYKKDGASWQYVTEAGDEFGFSCSDMKANADARKAMQGQVCLDTAGQVRLDSTEPALQ